MSTACEFGRSRPPCGARTPNGSSFEYFLPCENYTKADRSHHGHHLTHIQSQQRHISMELSLQVKSFFGIAFLAAIPGMVELFVLEIIAEP